MAKLYCVRIECEVIVIAEDEDEAIEAAEDAVDDIDLFDSATPEPLRYLPFGWDGREIPYNANRDMPERSVNEWIEAGAAPEMEQRMKAKAAPPSGQAGGEK